MFIIKTTGLSKNKLTVWERGVMQPSTWNETNQHWIPQFLLKGFGIRGNASRIYALNKQTRDVTICKVNKVASKSGLLTENDDRLMRSIEDRAAATIDAIRKGHINRIGTKEREIIDKLVCTMILNDPYSELDTEKIRREVIGDLTALLKTAVNRFGGDLNEPDMKDYFDEYLTHDQVSVFMDSNENQVIRALRLMGLQSCKPTVGECFIIGDSPVLAVRNAAYGQTSLLNPGSQVILPISSSSILIYSWAIETNVLDNGGTLSKNQVRSLNSDYFHGTTGPYLYGRDEEALKRSRFRPLQFAPHGRTLDVENGWFHMQQLEQIVQQEKRAHELKRLRTLDATAEQLVRLAHSQSESRRP